MTHPIKLIPFPAYIYIHDVPGCGHAVALHDEDGCCFECGCKVTREELETQDIKS
jgi:hypothetical protein